MNNTEIYIGKNTPVNKESLWLRPLNPGVSLYGNVNGKWEPLKLIDGKGTRTVEDDEVIDITGGGYSKEEIDARFADILGLDAAGIAELKALIEDDDTLTGLLSEIARKANTVLLSDYVDSDDPLPTDCIYKRIVGGSGREFKYLLPKEVRYSGDSYLIFRTPDGTDESFVYIVFKREYRTTTMQYYYNASYSTSTDEVPAWVEDAFGYTRSEVDAKIPEAIEDLSNIEKALNDVEYANFYEEAESAGTGKWITPTSTSHLTFSERMNTCSISPVTIDGKSYSYGLSILDAFDQKNPPVTVHVEDAGIVTFYIIGDSTIYTNPNITVKTKLDSESAYVRGETYSVSTQGYGIKIPVEMSSSGNIVLEYQGSWAIHGGSIYGVISMITYEGEEKHLINVGALKSSVDQLVPAVNNLVASAATFKTKLNFVAPTTTNYTALKNTYYRHGTLSSLSIALPSDSLSAGDVCVFSFNTSSSFPSGGFALSSTPYTQKKMKDFAIEAGKIYEVTAFYDGAMWLVTATEFK